MKLHVALFKTGGFIGRLIKWQTDGRYSHAALLFDMGVGRPYLAESRVWDGVTGHYVTPESLKDADLFRVPATDEQISKALTFITNQYGKGYDYWGVARFISRSRLPENERWFCSEIVFAALKEAEINLLLRIEAWQVSPAVLAYSPLLRFL